MAVQLDTFGSLRDGSPVTAAKLTNASGAALTVLDFGATIQALRVPNRDGGFTDVVLGYDDAKLYETMDGNFGGTIGRVGNRIGKAEFSLNGKRYQLAKNDGENHLHGGFQGFHLVPWTLSAEKDGILCKRLSPDGEENYPGNLSVEVRFYQTDDNRLRIVYDADTDADTLVNLTNHSYFNLDGEGDILSHRLWMPCERFAENDGGCLPTGRLLWVDGTPFDFRTEKEIGAEIGTDDLQLKLAGGYDHNYVLTGKKAAVLYGPKTGIEMTVETDLPGMQLYSGNFMTDRPGKNGSTIHWREGVCLETQLYPNAMNCYGFPSPVLRAGCHLHTETDYVFGVRG